MTDKALKEAEKAFSRTSDDTGTPRKIPPEISSQIWHMSEEVRLDVEDPEEPLTTYCAACHGKFVNYIFTLESEEGNVLTDCGGCCGVKLCKGEAKKKARLIKKEVYNCFDYLKRIRDQNRFNHNDRVFRISSDKRSIEVFRNEIMIHRLEGNSMLDLARNTYRYAQTLEIHLGRTIKAKKVTPEVPGNF